MATYVVLQPTEGDQDAKAERTVFIRDGFAFFALILPFVWLLWHRRWFEAGLVLLGGIALGYIGEISRFPATISVVTLLLSAFVALEGNHWRMAALERKGFRQVATVEADDAEEAEIRFFEGDEAHEPETVSADIRVASLPVEPLKARITGQSGTLGLVGYRGDA